MEGGDGDVGGGVAREGEHGDGNVLEEGLDSGGGDVEDGELGVDAGWVGGEGRFTDKGIIYGLGIEICQRLVNRHMDGQIMSD